MHQQIHNFYSLNTIIGVCNIITEKGKICYTRPKFGWMKGKSIKQVLGHISRRGEMISYERLENNGYTDQKTKQCIRNTQHKKNKASKNASYKGRYN